MLILPQSAHGSGSVLSTLDALLLTLDALLSLELQSLQTGVVLVVM